MEDGTEDEYAFLEEVSAEPGRLRVGFSAQPLYDRPVDIPEALYDKVLDVNLKGPFRLTAIIGTRMPPSKVSPLPPRRGTLSAPPIA